MTDPEGEGSSPWQEIQEAKDLLTDAYGPGEWVVQDEPTPAWDLSRTRVVYWQDCDCEWRSKYCDEHHTRSARLPLAVLHAAGKVQRGEGDV